MIANKVSECALLDNNFTGVVYLRVLVSAHFSSPPAHFFQDQFFQKYVV